MEKNGFKIPKKGCRRGFLNNPISTHTSGGASSASHEAMKRQHISEIKRLLTIRNESMKIRKSTNRMHEHGFIDDREREAFRAFDALFDAEPGLMTDTDVIKLIALADNELEDQGFADFQLCNGEFGRVVNMIEKELDMGLKVGQEVRVIGGRDIGKKGKILEVRDEDQLLNLRFLNDEEAVVWAGNVAILGSLAEDMCLAGLMEPKEEDMRFNLNNTVSTTKSSTSASSSSFQAKKSHLISELHRVFRIRNEYMQIRKSTNRPNARGFLDDTEREACETLQRLIHNAELELLDDPDVIQAIQQSETEETGSDLNIAASLLDVQRSCLRTKKAREEFIMGLKVGEDVRIVCGEDVGKKGKVLGVKKEEERVALRFLNGEEVELSVMDVAHLGSMAEDNCLLGLMGLDPDYSYHYDEAYDRDMSIMELMMSLDIKGKVLFGNNKF